MNNILSHQEETNKPQSNEQQQSQPERRQKIWIPLESNPRLYTEYAEKLGFPSDFYRFYDIFSTDPECW
jgi:hypothetical protein